MTANTEAIHAELLTGAESSLRSRTTVAAWPADSAIISSDSMRATARSPMFDVGGATVVGAGDATGYSNMYRRSQRCAGCSVGAAETFAMAAVVARAQ